MEVFGAAERIVLEASEHVGVGDADATLFLEERHDGGVRFTFSFACSSGGQQDGAAVEIEGPRSAGAKADVAQHIDECGRRVIGEMPVPQRVPLTEANDGGERVVLQKQNSTGGDQVGLARATLPIVPPHA